MHDDVTEWWNRISLRTKITGVTVLLLTLGLLVASVGTITVLRSYLQDQVNGQIAEAVEKLRLEREVEIDSAEAFSDEDTGLATYYLGAVTADGIQDSLPASEQDLRPDVSGLTLDDADGSIITLRNEAKTTEWRVKVMLASVRDTGEPAILLVGMNLQDTNNTIARLAAIFLFFGLTVVILGGALTRLLVTSTFTPLREVEATAARFAAGDFNQRIAGATPNTEVGRLNRSLNSMLSRIDHAFADRARTIDQMRRFVGDASHELRTPLVSVRGYAELYRMGALSKPEDVTQAMERIEKEAIRMGELVTDLLELARIDEAKPLQLTEVDLVPLARDAALDTMASAPDRVVSVVGTDIPSEIPDDVYDDGANPPTKAIPIQDADAQHTPGRGVSALATGPIAFAGATLARLVARRSKGKPDAVMPTLRMADPPRPELRALVLAEENKIRQVLANLIGNALRFTPEGSSIEIGVGVDAKRGRAVLSVIDHGEGIPEQIRGKIFQRFWRADSSRNRGTGGSGLGLAIVAAIVQAHKGDIEVIETPGGGATFRIALPLLTTTPEPEATPASE